MEHAETPIDVQESIQSVESLKGKHFSYTVVFGQGPVQERNRIPSSGREGLNFYSRMLSLSTAQMLKDGITDKVILTGGATGARAGTPEAQTEADLMGDIIRRRLTTTSQDGKAYIANGKLIETTNSDGEQKTRKEIDTEIKEAFSDVILIENEAQDTLQNFAFIINKFLDGQKDVPVALLGIGFHAKDTYSGAGVGRLALLADIFDIGAQTYSAEDVLNELVVENEDRGAMVKRSFASLTSLAAHHEVSRLKSKQEKLLVEGLKDGGEWVRALPFLRNPARATQMILKNDSVVSKIAAQLGIEEERVRDMATDELLESIQKVKFSGTPEEYGNVKAAIFEQLSEMKDEGTDYLATYGKGTIPKDENM